MKVLIPLPARCMSRRLVLLLWCALGPLVFGSTQGLQHGLLRLFNSSCGSEGHDFRRRTSGNTAMAFQGDTPWVGIRSLVIALHWRVGPPRLLHVWESQHHFCRLSPTTLDISDCRRAEPITPPTCEWVGKHYDISGPEDSRLFTWPPYGMFMLFHSKPAGSGPCNVTLLIPYLVNLMPESAAGSWTLPEPVALNLEASPESWGEHRQAVADLLGQAKHKNWVPFHHNGTLYFSVSLEPHIVATCQPSGRCPIVSITNNSDLFKPYSHLGDGPRGNTPAILVPASVTKDKDVYLGVFHYTNRFQGYTNVFFTMDPQPPFRITSISGDIPLVQRRYRGTYLIAFPTGLDLRPGSDTFFISYGSGDCESRVTSMTWSEVKELFGKPARTPAEREKNNELPAR